MVRPASDFTVLGKGIYTVSRVTQLLQLESTHVNSPGIHRWAFGYIRGGVYYDPAINTEAADRPEAERTLTFLEMVELMHIAGLLEAGKSWDKVRKAARVARRILKDDPHPFARYKWFADAASLYMELGKQHAEPVLLEMAGDAQVVFQPFLERYLKQIEFDDEGLARLWSPFDGVAVDPRRSMGLPVVAEGGVRTDILAGHHLAGDTISAIASWYNIPEYEVETAVRFESRLSKNNP